MIFKYKYVNAISNYYQDGIFTPPNNCIGLLFINRGTVDVIIQNGGADVIPPGESISINAPLPNMRDTTQYDISFSQSVGTKKLVIYQQLVSEIENC